ncbi:acetoacetate decarboxylase family protein [Nocardioides sp. MJB4]|uniref:Acetoacetate decarboxylase family protein n=1 Tax=Nocardioides donggukensis TaxID=2774019 RepID=A0A927K950_9ACTN|nr:acetoacetate decarboxylase family protein [Nocardioides donggukensis]
MPLDAVPALPDGVRALRVRGESLVVTAFVDYAEGGLLAYHELLAAVVVRHGRGLALSITDIWVDSPESLAGGRALWGIPKDLATFEMAEPGVSEARVDGVLLSAASSRPRRGPTVPVPRVLRGRVVQTLAGSTVSTRITAGGRISRATAEWSFPPTGPLAWLGTRQALLSVSAEDFALTFGPKLSGS